MANPPDFLLDAIEKKLVVQYTMPQDIHRLEPAMCARIDGNRDVVFGRSAAGGTDKHEELGQWKIVDLKRISATDHQIRFEDVPPVPQEMLELVVKVLGRER